MPVCQLCQNEKELCESHLIPAFVTRWIKSTSATGYIRYATNPNLRRQDGKKKKLLCRGCEDIFNKFETKFSNEIFYPYVNKELNSEGIATGKIKFFEYQSWLLKFIISLQWRVIIDSFDKLKGFPEKFLPYLDEAKISWREFLLNECSITGIGESHIIFLQNLAGGTGTLPKETSSRINFYLLRAIDGTFGVGRKGIFVYSKIGPIAFLTALKPDKLKNTPNTKVRMKGKVNTAQNLRNRIMNQFIFITRPNEAFKDYNISDKQQDQIDKTMDSDLERTSNSLTMKAFRADQAIKQMIQNS